MSTAFDHWHWPQYTIVAWWFLHLLIVSSQHGQEVLETAGPHKGQPRRYNAFTAFLRVGTWAFILIAGRFFA